MTTKICVENEKYIVKVRVYVSMLSSSLKRRAKGYGWERGGSEGASLMKMLLKAEYIILT